VKAGTVGETSGLDSSAPPAADCLHETRCLCVVAKYITDLADRGIDAVLGVEKDILTPETIHDFVTRWRIGNLQRLPITVYG
jgi:hypothetical protein